MIRNKHTAYRLEIKIKGIKIFKKREKMTGERISWEIT
jgi:hypothetical protein